MPLLDPSALVAAARARTGLDDLGEDTWQEGLEVLVRALTTEASLNELGVAVLVDQLTGYLTKRLEIERWYAEHPEIDEQEIVAPLFGLGMPRTGSTALSFLIACDRGRRSLRTWEADAPCPPPEAATEDTDPRIAQSAASIELVQRMFPDFVGMLPTSPTGPQECLLLLALDFRSQVFEGYALIPSYTEWILSSDMTPAYRYHKRVLKLLQWRCPPTRWWLKSPAHMTTIDALDSVYPDARFVMSHRDIGAVLPSLCALKLALGAPVTDRQDPFALGRHETALWSDSLARTIAFRDAGRENRFFDVGFRPLQRDPVATVDQLYRAMGDELSEETRHRMIEWWETSATERRQAAPPDPSAFGLDLDDLRLRFAFYHERFAITTG